MAKDQKAVDQIIRREGLILLSVLLTLFVLLPLCVRGLNFVCPRFPCKHLFLTVILLAIKDILFFAAVFGYPLYLLIRLIRWGLRKP